MPRLVPRSWCCGIDFLLFGQTALAVAYGETLQIQGLAAFLHEHLDAAMWAERPKGIQRGRVVKEGPAAVFAITVDRGMAIAISSAEPVSVAALGRKPVEMSMEDQRRLDEYLETPVGDPTFLVEKPPAYPRQPAKVRFIFSGEDLGFKAPPVAMVSPLPLSRASSGLPAWSPGPHTPLSPASSLGARAPTAEEVFGCSSSDEGERVTGRKRSRLALADDDEEEE